MLYFKRFIIFSTKKKKRFVIFLFQTLEKFIINIQVEFIKKKHINLQFLFWTANRA